MNLPKMAIFFIEEKTMSKKMTKFERILWEHDCYPLDKTTADAIADVKRTEDKANSLQR